MPVDRRRSRAHAPGAARAAARGDPGRRAQSSRRPWLVEQLPPDDYTVVRRSSGTRTSTPCSRALSGSASASSRAGRRTRGPSRRRARRAGARSSRASGRARCPGRARARPRARGAGARDGLALPARAISRRVRRQSGDAHARAADRARLRDLRPARDRRNGVRPRVYPRQAPPLEESSPCSPPPQTTASSTPTPGTVARNLVVFFAVVFWLATVYWVYKDARRRIEDPWLVAMATLLGAVPPFLGPLIYMLFRPPEYLEDVRERELEMLAIEERLAERDLRCPVCRGAVEPSYPRLPGLHDPAQAGVRRVRGAARADLAGLPVLRDARPAERRDGRGRLAAGSPAPAPAPRRTSASRPMAIETHTRARQAGRRPARRSAARSSRASSGAGYELRGARLLKVSKALGPRALRRAQGQAVLRRARRLHHLRPRPRARGLAARTRSPASAR